MLCSWPSLANATNVLLGPNQTGRKQGSLTLIHWPLLRTKSYQQEIDVSQCSPRTSIQYIITIRASTKFIMESLFSELLLLCEVLCTHES